MIEHVMAVVPVTDVDRAARYYGQLLGRAPDNRPMATLVEGRVTDSGWLQVFGGRTEPEGPSSTSRWTISTASQGGQGPRIATPARAARRISVVAGV